MIVRAFILSLLLVAVAPVYAARAADSRSVAAVYELAIAKNLSRTGAVGAPPGSTSARVYEFPQAQATRSGISSAVGAVAGGAASAAFCFGTGGWGCVAAVAVSTAVGAAITYAVDSAYDFFMGSDGQVIVPVTGAYSLTFPPQSVEPDYYYGGSASGCPTVSSKSPATIFAACEAYYASQSPHWKGGTWDSPSLIPGTPHYVSTYRAPSGALFNLQANAYFGELPPGGLTDPSTVGSKAYLDKALSDLPSTEQDKPMNPALLARMVNDAWAEASSQPGYQGIPYSPSRAVSIGDVHDALAELPSEGRPLVKDFGSSVGSADPLPGSSGAVSRDYGGATSAPPVLSPDVPYSPAPQPSPTPSTDPVTGLPVGDLVGTWSDPTPPGTPSTDGMGPADGAKLLSDSFDGWRNVSFSVPVGACPAISLDFDLFGTYFSPSTDSFCGILETYREFIQQMLAFVILIGAIMRVFSA